MKTIDLRSDTVTRPTPQMRTAMMAAPVGDDVYGEDPTVNALEARLARMTGKEAALLAPSGTQSNLLALLCHCQRGDEYIVGQQAHTYRYEGGGAAVLGGIQPQPLEMEPDGRLDPARVAAAIKPDDFHFARTRLVCLENTWSGRVLPPDYPARMARLCREHGLALHLDGARVFNAAVSQGRPLSELAAPFDSVSICLSKGLGAPVGTVLCGSAGFIHQARRWRKMLGGGMRQAGILAAAGLHALDHHVGRLAEDHANARRLAEGLAEFPELNVDLAGVETNMVFLRPGSERALALGEWLAEGNIRVNAYRDPWIRLVTHLEVTAEDVATVLERVAAFLARGRGG